MMSALLQTVGHVARFCTDGVAGVQVPKEQVPDLILLDIGMPVMDGYEGARALRTYRELDHCKIVALTAWCDDQTRSLAIKAGFDAHITKPVTLARLQVELGI